MTTIARRRSNPVAELLNWLEGEPPMLTGMRGLGLAPYIRIEDFVENGTYVLRAEMPGIDPDEDVRVEVSDGVLTLRGERKEEQHDRGRHEFHYGSFERSLRLPWGAEAEAVEATYTDGVLELRIPVDGEKPPSVRIPIQRDGM
jgi:HSP20 family protein